MTRAIRFSAIDPSVFLLVRGFRRLRRDVAVYFRDITSKTFLSYGMFGGMVARGSHGVDRRYLLPAPSHGCGTQRLWPHRAFP